MRPRSATLTGQELEVMKIVWDLGQATVRDVYEALLKHRKIAYTTVMTTMKILERKGHLKRTSDDKAHVYTPSRAKNQVIRGMVREFIDRVFNGATEPLLMHLVEDQKLTKEELREIARLVEKKS